MYLFKLFEVFVQIVDVKISKCICQNFKMCWSKQLLMYLSKLQNVFDDVQLMLSIKLHIPTGLIIPVGQFPLWSSCLVTLLRLLRPRRHNFFRPLHFSSISTPLNATLCLVCPQMCSMYVYCSVAQICCSAL